MQPTIRNSEVQPKIADSGLNTGNVTGARLHATATHAEPLPDERK